MFFFLNREIVNVFLNFIFLIKFNKFEREKRENAWDNKRQQFLIFTAAANYYFILLEVIYLFISKLLFIVH